MTESILAALITGGLSLCGVIYTGTKANERTNAAIKTAQAVTDTKLEHLTEEVREHNHFARRVPVVEEQIRSLSHRMEDLERKEQIA